MTADKSRFLPSFLKTPGMLLCGEEADLKNGGEENYP